MSKRFRYQANCEPFSTQAAGGEQQTLDRWTPVEIGKPRKKLSFANTGRESYLIAYVGAIWWEEGEGLMVTARGVTIEVTARATTVLVPARATTLKANA